MSRWRSSLCRASSRQSRTRCAAVSGASPQGHRGVAMSGTLRSKRKSRSPTFPVRICVRRELSCFRRSRCFLRASYENTGCEAGAGALGRSGGRPACCIQRRFQYTYRISSGTAPSDQVWAQLVRPSLYSREGGCGGGSAVTCRRCRYA